MSEPATKLDPEELRPGTVLLGGRLVIGPRIGRGGMSTVYAAKDRGRDVAVKIIASAYASDPSVCQRFRNEARLAQALADHPRVVTPYEVGEVPELDGRLYMTMPLIRGTPLGMVADRNDWRRWVAVMADVARTVAELHARGIVHRDIKPGNVILCAEHGRDVPYLLDFGSAYSEGDGHVPATAGLTRSDECPGTKLYMAPEQALGQRPAPSFDVYALGLSLCELLAGAHPLAGMSPAEAVRRKCNSELPSLSLRDHRPELPQALLEAVDRALVREPERRTQTAEALVRELEAALGGEREAVASVAANDGRRVVPASEPASRTWVVAAVLVVVLGGGLWWGLAGEPERAGESTAAVGIQAEAEPVPMPESADESKPEPEPAGEREPEPAGGSEPVPETDVVPEPEPPVVEVATPKTPTPKARPPHRDPSSPECVATRAAAQDAAARHDWHAVLKETARSRCWPREDLRRTLRVQALHALGDYRACVKAAAKAKDTATQRTARLCELALTHEGPASP